MAPNRKQLAQVVDVLVDRVPLVQAKYLPLTTATEEIVTPVAPQHEEPTTIRSAAVDDDYWNWSEPAPKKDLFSTAHMEANLRKDAERHADNKNVEIVKAVATNDSYWAERVEARYSESNAAVSNSTGYWDWSEEEPNTAQTALILKEEFARQQVSADRMEEHLRKDAAAARHTLPAHHQAENDSYWNWESPTTVRAEPSKVNESYWEWSEAAAQPETLIATILAYEKVRSMFSAEHVQEQLKTGAATTASGVKESSDSYWSWPAQDEEDYWNMRPLPAATVAAAAPAQGYWDW